MKANKILFPTDLSELSREALAYAAALARESGGQLLIAHVQEPGAAYVFGDSYSYGGADVDTSELRKTLESYRPDDANVRCVHRLLTGNPADELVRLAETDHVDLIVMATHGRTGLSHMLMGSVAEAVVRRAGCPVLTLKPQVLAATQEAGR